MSKLDMIKLGSRLIVGISTSFTVKSVIANNLQDPESTAEACKMAIGTVMVGALVAEAARGYIDEIVDSGAEIVQKVKDKREESKVQVQN